MRRLSGKETSWSQTLRSWNFLDASEIHARRLNAKEVIIPKNGEHFIFSIADGTGKLSERGQVFRKSTSIQDYPERDEDRNDDCRRESDGSQPLDTLTDDSEAETTFGRSQRITFSFITLNQELNSSCRMKSHSQDHCDMLTWSGEQTLPGMCY